MISDYLSTGFTLTNVQIVTIRAQVIPGSNCKDRYVLMKKY